MKKFLAELIGTMWLVLGGCGTAMLAGDKVGNLGVALAFGLSVLTMAYAFGPVSGAHLNPAVSIGVFTAGRLNFFRMISYIIAQCAGAFCGAAILYCIVTNGGIQDAALKDFACNGFGEHSPGGYGMYAAIVAEFAMTFMFLIVILRVTATKASSDVVKTGKFVAPIAIGLCLTLIHLITIPVTNTSVNPARSLSQALFRQDWAMDQLWLFLAVPAVAAFIAGLFQRYFDENVEDQDTADE